MWAGPELVIHLCQPPRVPGLQAYPCHLARLSESARQVTNQQWHMTVRSATQEADAGASQDRGKPGQLRPGLKIQ